MTSLIGDGPEGDAARLIVEPEPSTAELAAIVTALRSRQAHRTEAATGEPATPEQSRWQMVARREAVLGAGPRSWQANWGRAS